MKRFSDTERLILLMDVLHSKKIVGRTRLQKFVYLLKEQGVDVSYDFVPYFYGPYSSSLQRDLSMLCGIGILKEMKSTIEIEDIPGSKYTYQLTEEGKKIARRVRRKNIQDYYKLKKNADKLQNLSTGTLILASKYMMNKKLETTQSTV